MYWLIFKVNCHHEVLMASFCCLMINNGLGKKGLNAVFSRISPDRLFAVLGEKCYLVATLPHGGFLLNGVVSGQEVQAGNVCVELPFEQVVSFDQLFGF